MATKKKSKPKATKSPAPAGWRARYWLPARRYMRRVAVWAVSILLIWIVAYTVINPPTTYTILAERWRLGSVDREWVPIEEVSPHLLRSIVAAEDARYCLHWGFDMAAIRDALDDGAARGASTISQQTVKNAFLWQGRSWVRKALEALLTPIVEIAWTKRRLLEIYINIAEFDEGVFGVEAASRHYFRKGPEELTRTQAARLAAVLPSPKKRSASQPSAYVRSRARQIADGAATIAKDGRAACFGG